MRIGIDAKPWAETGGISRYLREICYHLDKILKDAEFILYSDCPLTSGLPSRRWRMRIIPRTIIPSSYGWLKFEVAKMASQDQLDAFWSVRTILPNLKGVKTVVTVHDLNFIFFPETMPIITCLAHKLWFFRDVAKADVVISVSQGTAARLKNKIGRQTDIVINPGVDKALYRLPDIQVQQFLRNYNITQPYLLHVGTIEPRKNLVTVIDAFQKIRENPDWSRLKLVLVGKRGWKDRSLIRRLNRGIPGVLELGVIPNQDLSAIYSGAMALVMLSLYEGYGIPAAEARSCGIRVIASDIPELKESGGKSSIYVEPTVNGMIEGFNQVVSASELVKTEPPRTWIQAAEEMADVFRGLRLQ